MSIQTIGLFGNADKRDIAASVQFIRDHCARLGVEAKLTRRMARIIGGDIGGMPCSELVRQVDVVVALGGDGTMLQAARAIDRTLTPLLGINLGSLGYLTDVPFAEVGPALDRLVAGDYHLEERDRLAGTAWRGQRQLAAFVALNDIVLNMGPLPRALVLEIRLDGESLGHFLGDGLILSTATGSTAYNLSAGGPICHAGVRGMLITPICPHSLGMRPLIVPYGTIIELFLHDAGEGAQLTADGQETRSLGNGDVVKFAVADCGVRLVKFPHSNFYRVMRHKLNWGGPTRRENGS
jgi:NAD+ kinase